MRGALAVPFWPGPQLALWLPLLFLLTPGSCPQGSPGLLQCHGVGPLGNVNCSWTLLGNLEPPSVLHFQSQKYHSNRTQTVVVPAGQSWAVIPRERLTAFDRLLIWGTTGARRLWPPVFVNLETRMKPDAPRLHPDVDFPEDEPLAATAEWSPPTWPPHKVLICQFYYRRCREASWTPLEPALKTIPLSPVEMQDLEPATRYELSGRCRVEAEEDLWGEWSPVLSFQTAPPAPRDVWVSGNFCEAEGRQELLLLWKAPESCVQVSYRARFWAGEKSLLRDPVPCCACPVPAWAERAEVSAVNATSGEPLANVSLLCVGPASAPRHLEVHSVAGGTELRATWQPGDAEPWEYVVDWAPDGQRPENLSWVRLPPGNLSARLPGSFEGGVPYRITVTAVFPWGVAPATVWGFTEELVPVEGPALWRLQDDPPGTPAIAWGEVPRQQLRGHLTHYTVCAKSRNSTLACRNVSSSTRTVTVPGLHWGPFELWVTASTVAGQGPPGPSLWLHLPDNTPEWRVLPGILTLWGLLLMGCGLHLAMAGRCVHLQHKVLPRWVWEKVPDPANSVSGQPHIAEVCQAQPLGELPILEVEEMEPPQASAPLHSGYEKHFLPTPEELGLLSPPRPQSLA